MTQEQHNEFIRLCELIYNIEVQLRNPYLSGHAVEALIRMDTYYRARRVLVEEEERCRGRCMCS